MLKTEFGLNCSATRNAYDNCRKVGDAGCITTQSNASSVNDTSDAITDSIRRIESERGYLGRENNWKALGRGVISIIMLERHPSTESTLYIALNTLKQCTKDKPSVIK
jgi:hypothetical protein